MNLIPARQASIKLPAAEDGIIGIRPEDFQLARDGVPAGSLPFELTVTAIEHVGAETYVYGLRPQMGDTEAVSAKPGEPPPGEILIRIPGQQGPSIGETITTLAPREKLHLFVAGGRRRVDL